jgi:hypothetical protein
VLNACVWWVKKVVCVPGVRQIVVSHGARTPHTNPADHLPEPTVLTLRATRTMESQNEFVDAEYEADYNQGQYNQTNYSQANLSETQPVPFDPIKHLPLRVEYAKRPEPQSPPVSHSGDASQSKSVKEPLFLLIKPDPFDEDAVNAKFQDEYLQLEEEARELDQRFQAIAKDLRLWIASSINPISVDAKAKYVPFHGADIRIAEEVKLIKTMEENQEDVSLCTGELTSRRVEELWIV